MYNARKCVATENYPWGMVIDRHRVNLTLGELLVNCRKSLQWGLASFSAQLVSKGKHEICQILHDQIFGPEVLHTEGAQIATTFTHNKTT